MMRALRIAATGMQAQEMVVDTIAHNISNVSTTGYRRQRAEFQDLLYETLRTPGGAAGGSARLPTGVQLGHGVRLVATARNFTQGALRETGGPLDVAIQGDGLLAVRRPDGSTAYTRAGELHLDAEHRVVTSEGFAIDPEIVAPEDATRITIAADGTVSAQSSEGESTEVGRLQLVLFANPAGLEAVGGNLYVANEASGEARTGNPGEEGRGTLQQGFLEGSNVELVSEMIDLIASQRAYEINGRVISAADDMLRSATQLR